LLIMVHTLPDSLGTQVTALNFGPLPVEEVVVLANVQPAPVFNMLGGTAEGDVNASGQLAIHLAGYEGKSLRLGGRPPTDI
jgi:hypothetical protein